MRIARFEYVELCEAEVEISFWQAYAECTRAASLGGQEQIGVERDHRYTVAGIISTQEYRVLKQVGGVGAYLRICMQEL